MYGVVEIMGHRTRAGALSDATIGGATMLRIEHPTRADHTGAEPLTEYYAPSAIFAIRPCSQEEATAVAGWAWAERVERPALSPVFAEMVDEDDEHHICECSSGGHDPDCEYFDDGEPF